MKKLLPALVLALGCAGPLPPVASPAAPSPEEVVEIESEPGFVGSAKTCGQGPVRLEVTEPTACEKSMQCGLAPIGVTTYSRVCTQTLMSCGSIRWESWSDWPECGGKVVP